MSFEINISGKNRNLELNEDTGFYKDQDDNEYVINEFDYRNGVIAILFEYFILGKYPDIEYCQDVCSSFVIELDRIYIISPRKNFEKLDETFSLRDEDYRGLYDQLDNIHKFLGMKVLKYNLYNKDGFVVLDPIEFDYSPGGNSYKYILSVLGRDAFESLPRTDGDKSLFSIKDTRKIQKQQLQSQKEICSLADFLKVLNPEIKEELIDLITGEDVSVDPEYIRGKDWINIRLSEKDIRSTTISISGDMFFKT